MTRRESSSASVLFARESHHGLMVGTLVRSPPTVADLPDEERELARGLAEARLGTFVAGRKALRAALERLGLRSAPLLRDDRGAPVPPPGVVASVSISHKDDVAVALVTRGVAWKVGIDVEIDRPLRFDIARRILTDGEMEEMHGMSEKERGQLVLRRFSAKEAIYKAIDPFVRRYVGFREVSLFERGDGLGVSLHLVPPDELEIEVAFEELELDDGRRLVLSTARARR